MNLNQITIPSVNLEKAIDFYQTLGLKLIVHSNAHYARFVCPDGTSTFSIQLVDQLPEYKSFGRHFYMRYILRLERLLNNWIYCEFPLLSKHD
jgi:catechol 2,3-dioxygenase-like lactoylglutathione lyase family enzyme